MAGSGSDRYTQGDMLSSIVSYTLMRLAVLLMLVLLSAFAGAVIVPALVSFLPAAAGTVKGFLTDGDAGVVFGTLTACAGLVWVFGDDGRKHAAYGAAAVNGAASIVLIYIFYFIPAVFRDSFAQEGKAELFYKVFYYPALWAVRESSTFTAGVLAGELVMITAALGAYVIVYGRYRKRYQKLTAVKKQQKK